MRCSRITSAVIVTFDSSSAHQQPSGYWRENKCSTERPIASRTRSGAGRLNAGSESVRCMGLFKVASFAALAAWTSLVFARGRFWEAPADELPEPPRPFKEAPRIHAVVPARNEASVLARTLPTLLNQRELAAFDITLVDDHSEDATADVARSIAAAHPSGARLSIVAAGPRPQGWTGKVWALHEGVRAARCAGLLAFHRCRHRARSRIGRSAGGESRRRSPRSRLVDGTPPLLFSLGAAVDSGVCVFLPKVISVSLGQ